MKQQDKIKLALVWVQFHKKTDKKLYNLCFKSSLSIVKIACLNFSYYKILFIFDLKQQVMKKTYFILTVILIVAIFSSCASGRGMAGGGCSVNSKLVGYR